MTALTFHPIAPAPLAITAALILLTGLLVREFTSNQRFLAGRIIAQTFVVSALLGIVLRPGLTLNQVANGGMLLTEDYAPRTADSLRMKYPGLSILTAPGIPDFKNSESLREWKDLSSWDGKLKFVVGAGIPSTAFDYLSATDFQYLKSRALNGITDLSAGRYFPHRRNLLKGKIAALAGETWIFLEGPSGKEDSLLIKTKGESAFELSFVPKVSGKIVYRLRIVHGSTTTSEILPLSILPEEPLSILFLVQAPSSEIKYLKNFLGDHGHSITLRYRISQNAYRYEYVNRPPVTQDLLTAAALRATDLIVADAETLRQLPAAQLSLLHNQIKAGLGILLLGSDGEAPPREYAFQQLSPLNEGRDTVRIIVGKEFVTARAFATGTPGVREVQEITATSNRRWTSAWRSWGAGRLGVQLLRETWPLILKEKSEIYSTIWTPLLETVARRKTQNFDLVIPDPFPVFSNDPISVEIISAGQIPDLLLDGAEVPLKENVVLDDLWSTRVWTSPAGWHELTVSGDSTRHYFYAFERGAWRALERAHQTELNQKLATGKNTMAVAVQREEPVAVLWFFLIFLISTAFLWLVPKL